ncbi:MAG: hypothetical protein WC341_04450 [Bacteroidales bacterium]|jgi:hypothetical protein
MEKITPENIKPLDWINIGELNAVVCKIYDNEPNKIEVVYLDRKRAINDDVHYLNGKWNFVNKGPGGGYADNYERLGDCVRKLKAGKWWEQ